MSASNQFTIATRGSQLALWQADFVTSLLAQRQVKAEKLVLTTTGDRVQDRFLHEIGGKGLFTKELEQALLEQRADLAVHSLKDMPAHILEPFQLTAILKRHSPRDLLILSPALAERAVLPPGAMNAADVQKLGAIRVGTGSLRRTSLFKRHAPQVTCVGVRGNVDTRLRKLAAGEWDALVLAEASLIRLDLLGGVTARALDPQWFIPCAAQGALAIEMRRDHPHQEAIKPLDDLDTHTMVGIERALLAKLGGDCTMPFGCLAVIETAPTGKTVVANAIILDRDGNAATAHASHPYQGFSADHMIKTLYDALMTDGAAQILKNLGLQ